MGVSKQLRFVLLFPFFSQNIVQTFMEFRGHFVRCLVFVKRNRFANVVHHDLAGITPFQVLFKIFADKKWVVVFRGRCFIYWNWKFFSYKTLFRRLKNICINENSILDILFRYDIRSKPVFKFWPDHVLYFSILLKTDCIIFQIYFNIYQK